jgi:hypothetical protein
MSKNLSLRLKKEQLNLSTNLKLKTSLNLNELESQQAWIWVWGWRRNDWIRVWRIWVWAKMNENGNESVRLGIWEIKRECEWIKTRVILEATTVWPEQPQLLQNVVATAVWWNGCYCSVANPQFFCSEYLFIYFNCTR